MVLERLKYAIAFILIILPYVSVINSTSFLNYVGFVFALSVSEGIYFIIFILGIISPIFLILSKLYNIFNELQRYSDTLLSVLLIASIIYPLFILGLNWWSIRLVLVSAFSIIAVLVTMLPVRLVFSQLNDFLNLRDPLSISIKTIEIYIGIAIVLISQAIQPQPMPIKLSDLAMIGAKYTLTFMSIQALISRMFIGGVIERLGEEATRVLSRIGPHLTLNPIVGVLFALGIYLYFVLRAREPNDNKRRPVPYGTLTKLFLISTLSALLLVISLKAFSTQYLSTLGLSGYAPWITLLILIIVIRRGTKK